MKLAAHLQPAAEGSGAAGERKVAAAPALHL